LKVKKTAKLYCAGNGFCKIETDSLLVRIKLGLILTFRYGFYRWGVWVIGVTDESIHPSFICFRKRILAGWDNWSGYYLLADNEETDSFLRDFYQKHCTT